jgi:hypothetical protein
LKADGSYDRVKPAHGEAAMRSQQRFLELAAESGQRATLGAAAAPAPAPAEKPKVVRSRAKKAT